jgi:hypothetical protein
MIEMSVAMRHRSHVERKVLALLRGVDRRAIGPPPRPAPRVP